MRDIPTLLELEEIPVLWQYLYMDEENFITVDNGMAKLEIRMRESCTFHAKNEFSRFAGSGIYGDDDYS